MQAIVGELVRRDVFPDLAGLGALGKQIAHELEHVLEYADRVDLQRLARQRVDGVINLGGVYETARARSVGQTVAREVMFH